MTAPRFRFWILALLTWVLCQAIGERTALSVAAPALMPALGTNAIELGWLFSAFAWSYVIAHVPAGALVDRWGARRVVAVGLGPCALASALNGLAGWMGLGFAALWLIAGHAALAIALHTWVIGPLRRAG